ncbi:MAG: hypothetical protein HQM08_28040 [Candidatus Riflebacteria bacterium]|nr:hypothetical protein [Candidatus Riflebacteria bacterium]
MNNNSLVINFDKGASSIVPGIHKGKIVKIIKYISKKDGKTRILIEVLPDGCPEAVTNSWYLNNNPDSLFGKIIQMLCGGIPSGDYDMNQLVGLRVKIEVLNNGGYLNFQFLKKLNKKAQSEVSENKNESELPF